MVDVFLSQSVSLVLERNYLSLSCTMYNTDIYDLDFLPAVIVVRKFSLQK